MSPRARGLRDHARAALVLLFAGVVVLYALPAPGLVLNKRKFRHPVARDWFERISAASAAIGQPMSPAEVSELAWSLGTDAKRLRRRAVRPFAPFVELFGLQQSWTMFASAPSTTGVLEVAVERDGAWQTVYTPLSEGARWQAALLEHPRVRSYASEFGWRRGKERFPRFAAALALRARPTHPDATRLRARMVPVTLPPPPALAADRVLPRGAPYFEAVVPLGEAP